MSVPSEQQGYAVVGLTETPSMEINTEKFSQRTKTSSSTGLNLKATELRLGLPGSESPERDEYDDDAVVVKSSNLMSGAKRGFSDAIIDGVGGGKWILSGKSGCEVDCALFSPKGVVVTAECSKNQQDSVAVKDQIAVLSPKPLDHEKKPQISANKEQVVGWPPIRSFRKNTMATQPQKNGEVDVDAEETKSGCLYVKVSMDGAPYLRKVDLSNFATYRELSSALEKMFSSFTISECGSHGASSHDKLSESRLMDLLHGSEYVLTYEDKDGDWMLVGDVPWKIMDGYKDRGNPQNDVDTKRSQMFTDSCKRLRIMKSSEAIGLAPRAMEKCKSRN